MVAPTSTSTLAVGPDGSVYIGGGARPGDITATPGAWQTTFEGSREGFVAKVNDTLSGYAWATYTGEQSSVLQLKPVADGASLWVSGAAPATLPVTPGALQSQPGPNFLVRLSSDGSQAITATYLPSGLEILALDASGNLLIESGYGGIFQATPGAPWPCETSPVFIGTIDAAAQHVLGGTSLPATLPAQSVAAGNIANTVIAYDNSSTGGLTLTAINGTSVSPHLASIYIRSLGRRTVGSARSRRAVFDLRRGLRPCSGRSGATLGRHDRNFARGHPGHGRRHSRAAALRVGGADQCRRAFPAQWPHGRSRKSRDAFGNFERSRARRARSGAGGFCDLEPGWNPEQPDEPGARGRLLDHLDVGDGPNEPPGVDGAIPIAAGGTPLLPITLQLATVQTPNLSLGPSAPSLSAQSCMPATRPDWFPASRRSISRCRSRLIRSGAKLRLSDRLMRRM